MFRLPFQRRAARASALALLVAALASFGAAGLPGCTDAGLYAASRDGVSLPDRADLEGTVCVPLATGDPFPVRVLFAIQGGEGVSRDLVTQVNDAMGTLQGRFANPYIRFAFVAFHTVATGLQGSFVESSELTAAVTRYNAYQEQGPVSLRSPLRLARSLLAGDMQTRCRGQVARTRYLVVLVATSADQSCANPAFNAGIDSRCALALDAGTTQEGLEACAVCELSAVTSQLKALAEQEGAGEVSVQPIYVRETVDPLTRTEISAIARAGGTDAIETDTANLGRVLGSLNYAPLSRPLSLKRLFVFNRNAAARNGALFPDSDGDGLSDDEEASYGTSAQEADSDTDGLSDGVEVRFGLKPQPGNPNPLTACSPVLDTDGDRLNDCEERVLGTDACMGDSDGDALPDLVEHLSRTNPLVPERLEEGDRDGVANVDEVLLQSDPLSADLAFQTERGHRYTVEEIAPTPDGRACFAVRAENISLMDTLARKNPPFPDDPAGTNDLYLYAQFGFPDRSDGAGVGSLFIQRVLFEPPATRDPQGTLPFTNEDLLIGF